MLLDSNNLLAKRMKRHCFGACTHTVRRGYINAGCKDAQSYTCQKLPTFEREGAKITAQSVATVYNQRVGEKGCRDVAAKRGNRLRMKDFKKRSAQFL